MGKNVSSRLCKTLLVAVSSLALLQLAACASVAHVARPEQLTAPMAIQDNSGEYMCSITRDKTLAEWSDKMAHVSLGASIGSTAGSLVGQQLLKQVPFIGGILGDYAGKKIGREIAISSAGGRDFIKTTSDLSFNSLQDLSLYLYVEYFNGDHYSEAVKAVMELYPDLKQIYVPTLVAASSQICQLGGCQATNESLCIKGPCQ